MLSNNEALHFSPINLQVLIMKDKEVQNPWCHHSRASHLTRAFVARCTRMLVTHM